MTMNARSKTTRWAAVLLGVAMVLRFDADSEEALGRILRDFSDRLHAIDPELKLPF